MLSLFLLWTSTPRLPGVATRLSARNTTSSVPPIMVGRSTVDLLALPSITVDHHMATARCTSTIFEPCRVISFRLPLHKKSVHRFRCHSSRNTHFQKSDLHSDISSCTHSLVDIWILLETPPLDLKHRGFSYYPGPKRRLHT